ncbi:MAG: carboxymethylenebutenolidase [Acidimicrobiales bacterium]|nr:carboxymethylenebutenolidase [Acidimicrobiales bacterium]
MTETRTDTVTVTDGEFDLHLWVPDGGRGPGLVLYQEIFGVGAYVRAVAERLVALGYVVGAPDLFWRQQRNWVADHDEAGLGASFDLVGRVDPELAVRDSVAALRWLSDLSEVDGRPGVIGFCFGGTMAWLVAAEAEPGCAVSYYGSGVGDSADRVADISCPTLLHFGADDPFIPADNVRRVADAVAGRDDIELHVHPGAGHAFDNHEAPTFHDPAASARAWKLTIDFLARNLPITLR